MICMGLLPRAEGCRQFQSTWWLKRCLGQVPSGLLPALEVDGQLWTESADIMSLLEVRLACTMTPPRKGIPAGTGHYQPIAFVYCSEADMRLQSCASLCHVNRSESQRLGDRLARCCQCGAVQHIMPQCNLSTICFVAFRACSCTDTDTLPAFLLYTSKVS